MTTRTVDLLIVWGLDGPPRTMGPGAAHRLHTRSAATETHLVSFCADVCGSYRELYIYISLTTKLNLSCMSSRYNTKCVFYYRESIKSLRLITYIVREKLSFVKCTAINRAGFDAYIKNEKWSGKYSIYRAVNIACRRYY